MLEARTEGWIAALQLAALSMQGRSDPASFIDEFAGDDRFILDYLADEVLERQPARIRDFLLDTSILSRLTGPLCAAVTGQDDAKAILEELDRSNLFLVPLDDRRTWYRYHHLFGDVVRARLLDEQPDRVPELHRRASDWYADNGDAHEAIVHALAGDDPERAAELIELVAPAMQRARQESQLRTWLEALPADLYVDRPVLAMALVGARMATGDTDDLDPLLEIVDSWLDRTDSPIVFDDVAYGRLPGHGCRASCRACPPRRRHRRNDRARAPRPRAGRRRRPPPTRRSHGAARSGPLEPRRARRRTRRATPNRSPASRPATTSLTSWAARSPSPTSRSPKDACSDAQRTFESALRHTVDHPGLRGAADMHVGLEPARHRAQRPRDRRRPPPGQRRTRRAHGPPAAPLPLESRDRTAPRSPRRPRRSARTAHRGRGPLQHGLLAQRPTGHGAESQDRGQTRRSRRRGNDGRDAHGLSADDELTYVREFEHITLAGVLLARGSAERVEQATGLLRRLLAAADDGHRDGSAIEILVLLALAQREQATAPPPRRR